MKRHTSIPRSPRNKLGGYNTRGKIWINPLIKGKYRKLVRKHENVEIRLRRKGLSYRKAHKIATETELKGLSKKEIQKYNNRLQYINRKTKWKR